MRFRIFVSTITLVAIVSGCSTIKESDRQLNHQNLRAAEWIAENAASEAVRGAAEDIVLNSKQLEKVVGLPKDPVDYSREASEAFRKQSVKDHAVKWWQAALMSIGSILLGGGLMKGLARFFPKLLGGPIGIALSAVTEGAGILLNKLKAEKTVTYDDAKEILKTAADNAGVREVVRRAIKGVAKKVKANG